MRIVDWCALTTLRARPRDGLRGQKEASWSVGASFLWVAVLLCDCVIL